ncbi:MAG: cytochrome c oxidase assembly protein [Ktedonobacterales bacterium]
MTLQTLLQDWPFDPAVIGGVAVSALLYWLGLRYSIRAGLSRRLQWWRVAAFAAGLLVLLTALDSPLDTLADRWLWAHMIQHDLLTMVVPPLLLLGAPAWLFWRAVPLQARRASLSWVVRQRWPRRLWHVIEHYVLAPWPVWLLYVGTYSIWHIPSLYDAALANQSIHALEHIMFLGTALLLWAQIIPSQPLQPRLSYPMRALYLCAVGMHANLIGSLFVFSVGPFYPHYALLPRPAGTMTALVDQHLAGAAMDVPGTIIFFVAVSAVLWLWLRDDERAPAASPLPAGISARR